MLSAMLRGVESKKKKEKKKKKKKKRMKRIDDGKDEKRF